ncbi:CopG family transcriptional regulator [Flammeovirga pectinis]|uniref:CopG family transcriptional regulator n=1 Tax=Flammeovirga pectinis TaxID=2494373 RepID=A0A3Q9FJ46_9BACT|nr:ribbon-helix-helix domain-containing protein [Flammeovirga pectinis]AZQ60957.1 CopG family transcriptional regulator [Flammeovirga pectinis]
MAKKSFSGGLDSLLGGAPIGNNKPSAPATTTVQNVIPKKENTTPTTVQNEDAIDTFSLLPVTFQDKITALSSKEGRSREEIIKEAIGFYLDFQVDL